MPLTKNELIKLGRILRDGARKESGSDGRVVYWPLSVHRLIADLVGPPGYAIKVIHQEDSIHFNLTYEFTEDPNYQKLVVDGISQEELDA